MMRHGPIPARDAGFTLMEAVVAMVLIGGVGMALAGWLNTNLATLSRVQQANARADAKINVLEYMEKVNPMQTPVGDADFGVYKIHWQAQANAGPLDDTGYPRGKGLYQIALYDTKVMVMAGNGQNWFDFQVQQVGYKQVRTQSFDE